jgi:hypothetical protein
MFYGANAPDERMNLISKGVLTRRLIEIGGSMSELAHFSGG